MSTTSSSQRSSTSSSHSVGGNEWVPELLTPARLKIDTDPTDHIYKLALSYCALQNDLAMRGCRINIAFWDLLQGIRDGSGRYEAFLQRQWRKIAKVVEQLPNTKQRTQAGPRLIDDLDGHFDLMAKNDIQLIGFTYSPPSPATVRGSSPRDFHPDNLNLNIPLVDYSKRQLLGLCTAIREISENHPAHDRKTNIESRKDHLEGIDGLPRLSFAELVGEHGFTTECHQVWGCPGCDVRASIGLFYYMRKTEQLKYDDRGVRNTNADAFAEMFYRDDRFSFEYLLKYLSSLKHSQAPMRVKTMLDSSYVKADEKRKRSDTDDKPRKRSKQVSKQRVEDDDWSKVQLKTYTPLKDTNPAKYQAFYNEYKAVEA